MELLRYRAFICDHHIGAGLYAWVSWAQTASDGGQPATVFVGDDDADIG